MEIKKTGHIPGESTPQENYSGLAAHSHHSDADDSSTQPAPEPVAGNDDNSSKSDRPLSSGSLADKYDREAPEELRK